MGLPVREEDAAPFNMAMLRYLEIHKVQERKIEAMLENNFYMSYDCLQEILSLCWFKFTEAERKTIEDILTEAKDRINESEKEDQKDLKLTAAKTELRKADRELSCLMHRYNMIFPRVDATGGLDKLRRKYEIDKKKES